MTHQANFETLHIRKWYAMRDQTLATESGMPADGEAVTRLVVGAAIRNPVASRFAPDLSSIVAASVGLGHEFGRRLLDELRGLTVESYGKGCIVGVAGDYEDGNAFLTTDFANPLRAAIGGGKAWIPSTGKRGGPGTSIDIPLAHRDALYVRSHYDTVTVTPPDAPSPDEIVVLFAVATRGRLQARLGGIAAGDVVGDDGLR